MNTILLSLHRGVGGHAMKLVIRCKRNSFEMRPEKTPFLGQCILDALGWTMAVQDLCSGGIRLEGGGAIDAVDQIKKTQTLLFPLDVPIIAGLRVQIRYHGGDSGPSPGLQITVLPPITSANFISWAASAN